MAIGDDRRPGPGRASGAERPLTIALGWRLPSWLLDVGPVALILVVGAVSVRFADRGVHGVHSTRALAALALGVCVIALLMRHRAPLVVLAIVLALALGLGWGPVVILPVLLAAFTVAEYSRRSRLIAAVAVAIAVVICTQAIHGAPLTLGSVVSPLVMLGLAVAVGLYLRARADYIGGLRERAERLERERELLADQAVAQERVRIARELHDVVAHNVSLMVVQAQAVAATTDPDERQGDALNRVADLGRDALSEMHRMLGVLRIHNGADAEREPSPGMLQIPTLIERTRSAGLDARLVLEGEPCSLPAGVDLSAYRIVQEALTNVIRHAAATHAIVTVAYRRDALEITVLDDGCAEVATETRPGGHGLIGMRERVALFGGELTAGPRPDANGYRVRALLPVN
ncbi:MAG: sensor histidine kinase [Solirubrobacteraceae bacterium]